MKGKIMNDLQAMYLEKASYTLEDTVREFLHDLLCNENTADDVIGRMLKTDKEAHDELIYYGKQMYNDAVNGINQRYKADGKYNDKYIFHFLGFDKCVCIDLLWTQDKNYFLLQILNNPGDFVCIEPSTYDTYILSDNPDRYKDALKDLDDTETEPSSAVKSEKGSNYKPTLRRIIIQSLQEYISRLLQSREMKR